MNWLSFKPICAAVLAAAVSAGAVWFFKEQQLNQLRQEVRRANASEKTLTTERDAALADAAANAHQASRLERQQSELMRLRAEVTRLRGAESDLEQARQQNRKLEGVMDDLLSQQSSAAEPADSDPAQAARIQRLNDAKMLVLGTLLHAQENGFLLPTDLMSTSNHWGDADNTRRLMTNRFEMVLPETVSFTNIANPASTIVLREREARWINGTWSKAYGFADGHAELKDQPPEGFDAWERERMLP